MKSPIFHLNTIIIGAIILLVLSCNPLVGSTSAPPPAQVAGGTAATKPHPGPLPAESLPEISALTPTFTLSPIPTLTLAPTVTLTPLPPLPDFESVVNFASGGGDPPCLYPHDPGVEGSTTFDGYYLPRSGIICIWGAPFNIPLQVTMRSPSGQVTLKADIQVHTSTGEVLWIGHDLPRVNSGAVNFGSSTAIYLTLWWPGQLESGNWQLNVQWGGGNLAGVFQANTREKPEISVVDPRSRSQLLPGRCLSVSDGINLNVAGESFPANTTAFVVSYVAPQIGQASSLVSKQSAQTDGNGDFLADLDPALGPGVYTVVGVSNPQVEMNYENIANALDCFEVLPQVSSCPGAPEQRMRVNGRGTVCTRLEAVKLRNAPNRSAIEIMQLVPGTSFEVIEGPSCADNWSWWKVRLDNGTTGWISEGGDQIDPYFLCPLN